MRLFVWWSNRLLPRLFVAQYFLLDSHCPVMPGPEGSNSFARLPPIRNLSLAYLFDYTKESVWLVVQRPLAEGVGYG